MKTRREKIIATVCISLLSILAGLFVLSIGNTNTAKIVGLVFVALICAFSIVTAWQTPSKVE